MRGVFALAMLLAGCDRLFGLSRLTYDDTVDAALDVPADAPCLGTGMLTDLCITMPAPIVALSSAIDTTTDARCRVRSQASGPDLCVIEGATIIVNEHVQVTGDRPLVLVAASTVEITATLDASSKLGERKGAGSQGGCASAGGANGLAGAGGGAGGTFGFPGGPGGAGQAGTTTPAGGGAPSAVVPLTGVFGGCAGGNGGVATAAAALGGPGGGAVYVIAGERIEVAGIVNASGSGGAGGAVGGGGGGGGGAGGFVALDAPSIVMDGMVFARGGGGGGGGDTMAAGGRGADPMGVAGQTRGGTGTTGGTAGGDGCGAPQGEHGGFTGSAQVGGGGGGGGCGRIRLWGTRSGIGATNPAPT